MEEVKQKFNASEFAAKKAAEFAAKRAEEAKKAEESVEVSTEEEKEVLEESEEEIFTESEETEEEQPEEPPVEGKESLTKREQALLKEVARLRADRRESRVETSLGEIVATTEEDEQADVTKAEARLFTAWRNEALADLQKKFPQYKTSPKLWDKFVEEYEDRVPDLVYAKRKGISPTKEFFADRLMRVHRAISDVTSVAKEEGKKEVLKTMSTATLMGAGSQSGHKTSPVATKPKSIYSKPSSSLADWIIKKS